MKLEIFGTLGGGHSRLFSGSRWQSSHFYFLQPLFSSMVGKLHLSTSFLMILHHLWYHRLQKYPSFSSFWRYFVFGQGWLHILVPGTVYILNYFCLCHIFELIYVCLNGFYIFIYICFQGFPPYSTHKHNQLCYMAERLLYVWKKCRKMVRFSLSLNCYKHVAPQHE